MLFKRLTSALQRNSTATVVSVLAIFVATCAVIFYVHNTLTEIERSLPVKILEQRKDVSDLEKQVSALRHLVETPREDDVQIRRVLEKIDKLDLQLRRIRSTYKLDNLMGAASLHAVVAPMLFDVRNWLTRGVNGYELTRKQVLSLVRTRIIDAHTQVQNMTDAADKLAFNIIEAESRKITSFRTQMIVVFAVLFFSATALIYYIGRIGSAQRALDEEREREQLALNAANLYDWEWDVENNRLNWGRDPRDLLGAGECEDYPNLPDMVHEADLEKFRRDGQAALKSDGQYKAEFRIRRTDGEIRWLESQGRRIVDAHGRTVRMIGVVQDITERKNIEQEIHQYAYYDSLTELPNRQHLVGRLEAALEESVKQGKKGALLFMDLDHFKNVNDSLGHSIGDKLLKKIADRIREVVRSTDLVGRLGGDEFTVLLPGLSESRNKTKKIARHVGEKIQQKLAMPYKVDGHELQVSVSIGISIFPLENSTEENMTGEILKNADTAMYRAKAAGRHTIKFYINSMQRAASRKLALQRVIQQALVRNQVRFSFQPQVNLEGRIVGAEALLRLDAPEAGKIDTKDIIDVAEESGLVLPLGDWVIVRACRHIKTWTGLGVCPARLSINVSPSQFHQNDFVDRVIRILSETGADPALLEMEITEGILMMDIDKAIEKMHALKQLGVQFAVDDFGTGYSSLAYLKRLPLDRIKIDCSFTREIDSNDNDALIVETIISMARSMKLEVVAEGVETEAAFEALVSRSCSVFQGHYFSRPLGEERFMKVLKTGLSNRVSSFQGPARRVL